MVLVELLCKTTHSMRRLSPHRYQVSCPFFRLLQFACFVASWLSLPTLSASPDETILASHALFRGNLAGGQPILASSSMPSATIATLVDHRPDWTHLAKMESKEEQLRALREFVAGGGSTNVVEQLGSPCVTVTASDSSGGQPQITIDLGREHEVGFVRLYDGQDTTATPTSSQQVLVALSSSEIGDSDDGGNFRMPDLRDALAQQPQLSPAQPNMNVEASDTPLPLHHICGGGRSFWNISALGEPVDVPCFARGRYLSLVGREGRDLTLCSIEVGVVDAITITTVPITFLCHCK